METKDCVKCGRQLLEREDECRYCNVEQPETADTRAAVEDMTVREAVTAGVTRPEVSFRDLLSSPQDAHNEPSVNGVAIPSEGDKLLHGSYTSWNEYRVAEVIPDGNGALGYRLRLENEDGELTVAARHVLGEPGVRVLRTEESR